MTTFPTFFEPGSPNKNHSESQNHKRIIEDSHRGGGRSYRSHAVATTTEYARMRGAKRREARILPSPRPRLVNPLMAKVTTIKSSRGGESLVGGRFSLVIFVKDKTKRRLSSIRPRNSIAVGFQLLFVRLGLTPVRERARGPGWA